jgi:hypothetical protein
MKKVVKDIQIGFGACIAILCLFGVPRAALLEFSPVQSATAPGECVSIDMMISDLGASDLGAFDITINYDPALLDFVSFNPGDQLGKVGMSAMDLSIGAQTSGSVNIAELSLMENLDFQPASFSLGQMLFTGKSSGDSPLSVVGAILGDAAGNSVAWSARDGSVSVPEPSMVSMLLFGVACLGCFKMKTIRMIRRH